MQVPKIEHRILFILLFLLFTTVLHGPVLAQYDVNNTGVSDVNGLTGSEVQPAIGSDFGTVRAIADTNNAYALFGDGNNITISGDFPTDGIIYAEAGNNGAYGLHADGNGVITAGAINGSITATAGNESAYGLYSSNSITIGDVNGTIAASAYLRAFGLRSINSSITTGAINGIINAISDTNDAFGLSAYTSITTGNINGTITATAGNENAYGLYSRDFIETGDVNGVINSSAYLNAYGLRSLNSSITTGVIDGEITALSDTDYAYGLSANTSIIIGDVNGIITANAGNDYAFGVNSSNGLIEIGTISNLIDVDANNYAYGISSDNGSIDIDHINGKIYTTALTSHAYGLHSNNGSIEIGDVGKNGYIFAYAHTDESYGVFSYGVSITTGDIDGTIYALSDNNDAFGMYSYSDSGSITTGSISGNVVGYARGDNGYGILSYGPMDITVDGGYIVGYSAADANTAAAIQSGRIESGVLNTQNANDSVEIVAGSRIYGDIDLGMSGSDSDILVLSGLDANSTTLNHDLKNIETINLTGGTWHLNGTVSDNANGIIMTGGVLSGTGTLGSLNVTGGTVAPGNSIGTTTVDGDFTIDSGGTLEIELDNSGNSDKLIVTGDATINGGTLKAISTETISRTQEYTIIEANNVSGQFDTLDTALLHTVLYLYSTDQNYLSDSVILTVIPEQLNNPDFLMTANQLSLGNALQQIADNGGNGVTTELQQLTSLEQVRAAYDQLCGQTRTSLAFVASTGNSGFTDTVSSRLNNTHSGVSMRFNDSPLFAMAQPDRDTTMNDTQRNLNSFAIGNGTQYFASENWGMWMRGYGIFGERDSDSGSPGYQYRTYGSGFGMDFKTSKEFILGLTGGYSYGHVDYSSSRDESDITGMPMGIYGSWFSEGGYIDAILTYTPMKYETTRYVDLTSEKLEGDFDGFEAGTYWELGRNLYFGKDVLVQPMTSFQISYLNLDNYTETGGVSALSFDEQTYKSYKGSLGMKMKTYLGEHSEYESLILELRGRWQHEFGDTKSDIDANFSSNPGTIFKVSDEGLPDNSTILGIGLKQIVKQNTMYYIDYDTSFNDEDTSHIISAGLRYRW